MSSQRAVVSLSSLRSHAIISYEKKAKSKETGRSCIPTRSLRSCSRTGTLCVAAFVAEPFCAPWAFLLLPDVLFSSASSMSAPEKPKLNAIGGKKQVCLEKRLHGGF